MSEELIEKYADLTERLNMLNANMIELLEKAVTPEVKKAQEEIEAEFTPMIEATQTALAEVKAEIEALVKEQKTTLKGSRYMATYNKGRDGGWDGKKLEGYALVHPEIMAAKKPDGEPTVSFRQVLRGQNYNHLSM